MALLTEEEKVQKIGLLIDELIVKIRICASRLKASGNVDMATKLYNLCDDTEAKLRT